MEPWRKELYHYGVPGMKWGVRRYQPYPEGKRGVFIGDKNFTVDYGYSSPYTTKNVKPKLKRYPFTRIETRKSAKASDKYWNEYKARNEVLKQKREKESKKHASEVASILESMSDDDLQKIEISRKRIQRYTTRGDDFVKRFVLKDENNIPVSFLDLQYGGSSMNVVIGTRGGEEYRKKGYASELTKIAMNWVDQNSQYMEKPYDYVHWGAHTDNVGSRRLAEKSGFEYLGDDEVDSHYYKNL